MESDNINSADSLDVDVPPSNPDNTDVNDVNLNDNDNNGVKNESNIAAEDENANNETEEQKIDPNVPQISIVLEIPRIQWFIIKNDHRKQLACDNIEIVTHPEKKDILVFTFPSNPEVSYVLCKQYLCMKMEDNNYIFAAKHEFFGLYIDTTNSTETIEKFEELVKQYSHLKVSSKKDEIHKYPHNDELYVGPPDKIAITGVKLASYIRKGTVVVTRGIRNSTASATTGLHKQKDKLKSRLVPREEPARVSPTTQGRLFKAKMGAQAIVKVSGAILTGTMAAANALSNEISDAIADTELGKRFNDQSGPKTKAAKDLIKSSISGVVTVYDEVVNAGLHLVRETGSATTEIVGHKYGEEAKQAAQSTSEIVDSAAQSVVNINRLGVKSLAKRVTANTTVDLLSDENEKKEIRDARVAIDPMTGMQVLMTANQISNIKDKYSDESRKQRLNYVGLEPWDPNNVENVNNAVSVSNVNNGNSGNMASIAENSNDMLEIDGNNGNDVNNDVLMSDNHNNNNDEVVETVDIDMDGDDNEYNMNSLNGISNNNGTNNNDNDNSNDLAMNANENVARDSIFEEEVFDVD